MAHANRRPAACLPQWSTTGDFVNFPFSSPYPPYVVRTLDGDAPDKIVAISDSNGAGSWTLSAFDAATGAVNWTATVSAPDGSNDMLTAPCSGLPMSQQLENGLSMMFMQLGATVLALDPSNGRQLWQHPTYNQSVPKITGYRCAG
jgi:outer membrane protein assembly factor BamB